MPTIEFPPTYNGPPGTGHGGYVAGRLAELVPAYVVEVTLRRPPPLGRPLRVEEEDGTLRVRDGDTLVAEARPGSVDLGAIDPPSLAEARAALPDHPGFRHHEFPTCFGCGPARDPGDGMRIFAGPLERAGRVVAAWWRPFGALADDAGHVLPEFVWAALDCSGAFTIPSDGGRPRVVLGRLAAELRAPVPAHDDLVVFAWHVEGEGRRHEIGSGVADANGAVLALGQATWVRLRDEPDEPDGAAGRPR